MAVKTTDFMNQPAADDSAGAGTERDGEIEQHDIPVVNLEGLGNRLGNSRICL